MVGRRPRGILLWRGHLRGRTLHGPWRTSRSTASTARRRSTTSSARRTSRARCATRSPRARVAHAYLFTGPRGTGKTTTARILAKALECETGPTPEPDGTCQSCIDIAEGRHPDVYELDAASRTQVENVREEIIGRLAYAPTRGRWKVYIIDEVHMLSTSSFNALLKSIEEPPSHVVFVLCTTHPHKVPETIHSRCQRFDFRRIGVEDIVERLQVIADAEGISVAEGSLALIAQARRGRDARRDHHARAARGVHRRPDHARGRRGTARRGGPGPAVRSGRPRRATVTSPGSFRFVARLAESGADLPEFVRGLTGHVRDLYVTHAVGDADRHRRHDHRGAGAPHLAGRALRPGPSGARARRARRARRPRCAGPRTRASSLEVAFTRLARPHGELTARGACRADRGARARVQPAPTPRAGRTGDAARPAPPRPHAAPSAPLPPPPQLRRRAGVRRLAAASLLPQRPARSGRNGGPEPAVELEGGPARPRAGQARVARRDRRGARSSARTCDARSSTPRSTSTRTA